MIELLCVIFISIPIIMVRWYKNRLLKGFLTLFSQFILLAFSIEITRTGFFSEPSKIPYLLFLGIFVSTGIVLFWKTPMALTMKRGVEAFLKEWSPELYEGIFSIKDEIVDIDKKIKELKRLRTQFPEQKQRINRAISEWTEIQVRLQKVLKETRHKIDDAYILYKLDEMKEQRKFEILKQELEKKASSTLAYAQSYADGLQTLVETSQVKHSD